MNYRTPGVYIVEKPTLPPAVAALSTAVPAFLGYTEKGENTTRRITNLLEFEQYFGKPAPLISSATVKDGKVTFTLAGTGNTLDDGFIRPQFYLHYAVNHYFLNGGGPCYIASVGSLTPTTIPDANNFKSALDRLKTEDEPTLIVVTDTTETIHADTYQNVLAHCAKMRNRFAILDVRAGSDTGADAISRKFGGNIGTQNLSFGAAYYPFLKTTLPPIVDEKNVDVLSSAVKPLVVKTEDTLANKEFSYGPIKVNRAGSGLSKKLHVVVSESPTTADEVKFLYQADTLTITLKNTVDIKTQGKLAESYEKINTAWATAKAANPDLNQFTIEQCTALQPTAISNSALFKINERKFTFWDGAARLFVTYTGEAAEKASVTLADVTDRNHVITYTGTGAEKVAIMPSNETTQASAEFSFKGDFAPALEIKVKNNTKASDIMTAWDSKTDQALKDSKFSVTRGTAASPEPALLAALDPTQSQPQKLSEHTDSIVSNLVKTELAKLRLILPPGAAVAGVYASTDASRGVWKAPANVGLAATIGPVVGISNDDQNRFNVPDHGKAINAIRTFAGKGTLVWGARTLDGNNPEWRYVPVRRLFLHIEESIRRATSFAVFEPNDATTWLKVKGLIESFLYGLWQQGALAASVPEQAYFVDVGLGSTMTDQDILAGIMKVAVGIAAVRPAEFIIITFTHQLQQS
jgi:uncharacterized protein